MGLPLAQSSQQFNAMDLNLRQEFKEMVGKLADKYNVSSIVGASFMLQYGYRFKYCAYDIVYAMLAVLESTVSLFCQMLCRKIYFSSRSNERNNSNFTSIIKFNCKKYGLNLR
jgi:hypothetical protein